MKTARNPPSVQRTILIRLAGFHSSAICTSACHSAFPNEFGLNKEPPMTCETSFPGYPIRRSLFAHINSSNFCQGIVSRLKPRMKTATQILSGILPTDQSSKTHQGYSSSMLQNVLATHLQSIDLGCQCPSTCPCLCSRSSGQPLFQENADVSSSFEAHFPQYVLYSCPSLERVAKRQQADHQRLQSYKWCQSTSNSSKMRYLLNHTCYSCQ